MLYLELQEEQLWKEILFITKTLMISLVLFYIGPTFRAHFFEYLLWHYVVLSTLHSRPTAETLKYL